jgi:hypothetical protein
MQSLSPEQILAVWERGRPQHALDRALTILAAATPEASRAALADLPIGERDARLLQLRALVFGPRAEAFAECPNCTERVEFPLDTSTLDERKRVSPEGNASTYRTTAPGSYETDANGNGNLLRFRLPTSRDLVEVVTAADDGEALRLLVQRCSGQKDLPNESIAALSRAMLEADPQAEITLRLTCPACGHEWDLLFDIAEFLWRELSAQAHRLLREIDTLARAYGWTEREILNLPAQRRQTYLEMLAA